MINIFHFIIIEHNVMILMINTLENKFKDLKKKTHTHKNVVTNGQKMKEKIGLEWGAKMGPKVGSNEKKKGLEIGPKWPTNGPPGGVRRGCQWEKKKKKKKRPQKLGRHQAQKQVGEGATWRPTKISKNITKTKGKRWGVWSHLSAPRGRLVLRCGWCPFPFCPGGLPVVRPFIHDSGHLRRRRDAII